LSFILRACFWLSLQDEKQKHVVQNQSFQITHKLCATPHHLLQISLSHTHTIFLINNNKIKITRSSSCHAQKHKNKIKYRIHYQSPGTTNFNSQRSFYGDVIILWHPVFIVYLTSDPLFPLKMRLEPHIFEYFMNNINGCQITKVGKKKEKRLVI
jgi:hypothetical protein